MNKLKQKRNSKINFDRGSVRRPNAMNLSLGGYYYLTMKIL